MCDIDSERLSLTEEKSSLAARPARAVSVKPAFTLFDGPS